MRTRWSSSPLFLGIGIVAAAFFAATRSEAAETTAAGPASDPNAAVPPSAAAPASPGAPSASVSAIALPGAPAEGVALDYLAVDRGRHRVWVPAGGTGNTV